MKYLSPSVPRVPFFYYVPSSSRYRLLERFLFKRLFCFAAFPTVSNELVPEFIQYLIFTRSVYLPYFCSKFEFDRVGG